MRSKNKKIILNIIAVLFTILILIGCSDNEPIAIPLDIKITVKDGTGYFDKLFMGKLPYVNIKLKSIETGREFKGKTDSSGSATISWIQSGYYDVIVERIISAEEMFQATGDRAEAILSGQRVNVSFDRTNTTLEVTVNIPKAGTFVISEIYYTGAKAPPNFYFSDQYTEIYNNTDSIRYIDGLIIAQPVAVKYGFISDNDFLHCSYAWQFPGNGKQYPIQPGGFMIVAQDGIDHRGNNPASLDLSTADFEYFYDKVDTKDIDNPEVPNMIKILMKSETIIDVLYGTSADAMILCKVPDATTLKKDGDGNLLIPSNTVIDGVEWLQSPKIANKKLIPSIDVSFTGCIPAYSSRSVERRTIRLSGSRKILSDLNNSSVDFDTLSAPTYRFLH